MMNGRDTHTKTMRVAEKVLAQKQPFSRSKTGPQNRVAFKSHTRGTCGKQNNAPLKEVYILIPKTRECVTLQGKRDFEVVIKLRILSWENYPGLSAWAQRNHKGPYNAKREAEELKSEEEAVMTEAESERKR